MIDTLRLAERIERELHTSPELARAAAHLAKDVAEEATRDLATKADLHALEARLELAMSRLQLRIGVMLGVAVTILLAGIAVIPPIVQWIVRA
jgi:hypothetical protein